MIDKNKKILITGGRSGFGQLLARCFFDRGYRDVHLLLNPFLKHPPIKPHPKIRYTKIELLDLPLLDEQISSEHCIIHTGIIINSKKRHKYYTHLHNEEGTANLINIALEKQTEFVYIGSVLTQTKISRQHSPLYQSLRAADMQIQRGIVEGLSVRSYFPGAIADDSFSFPKNLDHCPEPVINGKILAEAVILDKKPREMELINKKTTDLAVSFYQAYEKRNTTQNIIDKIRFWLNPRTRHRNPKEHLDIDIQLDTYTR